MGLGRFEREIRVTGMSVFIAPVGAPAATDSRPERFLDERWELLYPAVPDAPPAWLEAERGDG